MKVYEKITICLFLCFRDSIGKSMDLFRCVFSALWQHDFSVLLDQKIIGIIYSIMFFTLFLENGLLPASFLPGDSLLLLAGVLISQGVMDFTPTIVILTMAASLGCWVSYLQGRWLGDSRIVKAWLFHLPKKYHHRAIVMFDRHGLLALLAGRFFAFIRTILPTIAGISGLSHRRFQFFNWLSGFLWVGGVTVSGYLLHTIPFIKRHEAEIITLAILLPIILLIIGLVGTIALILKKRYHDQ